MLQEKVSLQGGFEAEGRDVAVIVFGGFSQHEDRQGK